MKTPLSLRLLLGAFFFSAAALTSSCSTGTDQGDTNVETGTTKDFTEQSSTISNGNTTAGDSATAGLQRDTTGRPTGRQQYEAAGSSVDHDRDGKAD